jgi:CubicO group peptidase (beta-lactamase class C family)
MTVRDMSHCSGLSALAYEVIGKNGSVFVQHNDVIQICNHLPQLSKFRSEWMYNNWMFALAGGLVAQESGQSYGQFVRREILAPLGMEHSYLDFPLGDNFARPYLVYDDGSSEPVALPALADGDAFDSSGAMRSCVSDLVIWAKALMHAWRTSHSVEKGQSKRCCFSLFQSCLKPRTPKAPPFSNY